MSNETRIKISRGRILRQLGLVVASVIAVVLLHDQIVDINPDAILALFQEFPVSIWLAAGILTALSLAAVGGYDILAARYLQIEMPDKYAFSVGWRSTAIAQTLGFGLFTGSLVRWKLLAHLPDVTLWRATQMTSLVTACFFGGWAIVASFAAVLTPGFSDQVWWLGMLGLWLAFSLAAMSLQSREYLPFQLPPIRLMTRATALAAIDTAAACGVIYAFTPEGYISFSLLYPAFLIAYCAGMASGVPGGVGPFEVCLLAILTPADSTPLLAALLAYRAAYFLAPAVVAGISLLASSRRPAPASRTTRSALGLHMPPESCLLVQGQLSVIDTPTGAAQALGRKTSNTELHLRDPFGGPVAPFLANRLRTAKRDFRGLLVYKCGQQAAQIGATIGLKPHQIASEAVLDVESFTLQTPKRSQLRRKLRACTKKDVQVRTGAASLVHMQNLDKVWQHKNGIARGFSMGVFSPSLIAKQAVFTAYKHNTPVAFVTFHTSADKWVLDIIRSGSECPDGTIHALICAAIEDARSCNVAQVSLCSVPLYLADNPESQSKTWVETVINFAYKQQKGAHGLQRFKSSFAPDWEPQFIAADSLATLLIGSVELYGLIYRPPAYTNNTSELHDHYDDYEFASPALACEEAR